MATVSPAKKLLDAYPTCSVAVAWCEMFVFDEFAGDVNDTNEAEVRDLFRRGGIDAILTMVRGTMQECIDEGDPGNHVQALEETHVPEFKTYLAGRFGCM